MKDYSKAFKAFDIRAVWHDPIDDSFAYSLGTAIGVDLIKRKGEEASFLFGCDARERNNTLAYWFLKGMEEAGVRNYIGMGLSVDSPEEQSQERGVCSTAVFYNFVANDFDMGVIFTASHNPPEYAGMKIVNEHGHLIPSNDLHDLVTTWEDISDVEIDMEAYTRIREISMMRDDIYRDKLYASEKLYRETLQDLFGGLTKPMKIVIDFSNGGAISYERTFLDGLMSSNELLEFIYINDTADSTFAAHLSDTTNPHDYEQLMAAVKNHNADMGVMFDGDGDRLGYVDEKGQLIPGDIAGGLIALHILAHGDKKNVIHDVFTSRGVTNAITKAGGNPIKSRVGHRFVKEKFQEHDAAFGGEISGHQFFNEIGGFESPMCALGHFLMQAQASETVSAAIAPLLTYYKPPLIKIKVADRDGALQKIEAYYAAKGYDIDHTDGVGIYTPERRVVLRASHTEPILRLCIETQDKDQYDTVLAEIEKEIG